VVCGAFANGACEGGYPIAATRCDVWCNETRRVDCDAYDPAECVATCERAGLGRPECADLVMQAVECLHAKTDQELACATWALTGATPCQAEQGAALTCGAPDTQDLPPSSTE
jgi:hypothetical protein